MCQDLCSTWFCGLSPNHRSSSKDRRVEQEALIGLAEGARAQRQRLDDTSAPVVNVVPLLAVMRVQANDENLQHVS